MVALLIATLGISYMNVPVRPIDLKIKCLSSCKRPQAVLVTMQQLAAQFIVMLHTWYCSGKQKDYPDVYKLMKILFYLSHN